MTKTLILAPTTGFLKLGYSEKATKLEKIFHLKFDVTQQRQSMEDFFLILWPSQNIRTLCTWDYTTLFFT